MADIEKVIKGLECCLRESEHIDDNPCKNCPYYDVDSGIGGRCMEEKDKDAIELLKEQQKQIDELEYNLAITQNNLNFYVNGND